MAETPERLPLDAAVERAILVAQANSRGGRRTLIGIAGAPGAGKSWYAAELASRIRDRGVAVALVPMDGFHLAHAALVEAGTVDVKGAPHTFDAEGYVNLLARLRSSRESTVWAPTFDRDLEDAIAASIPVAPDVDLVLTEGNYLLLDDGAWSRVGGLLDECWFVDVDEELRRERLAARHESHGRSRAEAWERTNGSDEANARLINATRHHADALLVSVTRRARP